MQHRAIPSFKNLWANYPTGETADVKVRIGGQVNADWISNTSAIRLCRSLNYAGEMVPKRFMLKSGKFWVTAEGGDKRFYAARVKELHEWIVKTYGPPSLEHKNDRDGGSVPASFEGKKGIIVFDIRIWSDSTGHFDLWDGVRQEAINKAYFDKAREIRLWVAPE
jgi:hypothetical protein